MVKKITILIATSDDVIFNAVKNIVTGEIFNVHQILEFQAVEIPIFEHSSVLIVDLGPPSIPMSKWDFVKKVRSLHPSHLPTIILAYPSNNYDYLKPDHKILYDICLIMPVDLAEILHGIKKLTGYYPWGVDWDEKAANMSI